jgi:hypothetical protein
MTTFGKIQPCLHLGVLSNLNFVAGPRPGHREIRILLLMPGNESDQVECDVRVVSLDSNEQYEALSYVWGEIMISGHTIRITHNLHAALHRLRLSDKLRSIWVDQLCINQSDNTERAVQVSMMRDIYRRCSQCVIWLGEIELNLDFSIHDAREVFRFIRTAADLKRTEPGYLPLIFRDTLRGERTRKAFEAFSMYGNPWWSRIWTIQEAIVPSSATFTWGVLTLDRDLVLRASNNLHSSEIMQLSSPQFRIHRLKYTPLLRRLLYPIYGFRLAEGGDGPLNLLMRWRHRDATDPRDKVYGLGGLLPPGAIRSAEQCSYDIPVTDLFQNVTLDLIKHEDGLRALIASQEISQRTPNLASWAIDFACVNLVGKRQLKWWNHSHRYGEFSAAAGTSLQVGTAQEGKVLTLTGIFVDEIVAINSEYTVEENEHIEDDRLLEVLQSARQLMHQCRASYPFSETYITGTSYATAFFRTLIGDLIMKEFPVRRAGPSDEASFDAMLKHAAKRSYNGAHQVVEAFMARQKELRSTNEYSAEAAKQLEELVAETGFEPFDMYESLCGMLVNHRFFVTNKGYIGIGPPDTRPGDQVWVFHGGNVPFITRKTEVKNDSEGHHHMHFVGDAYVHGIMDGEALKDDPETQSVWLQ